MPASLLALGLLEGLVLFGAMYAGVALRFATFGPVEISAQIPVYPLYPKALVFSLTMLGIMVAMGLYQREYQQRVWHMARLMMSFVIGLAVIPMIFYVVPALFLGRGAFALAFLVAFIGVAVVRFVYLTVSSRSAIKRRVLVLGTGTRAAKISALESASGGRQGFKVIGYLPTQKGHHFVPRDKVLADRGPLCDIARKYEADEIVIGVRERRGGGLPIDDVLQCKVSGIPVVELSSFFERETGHVQLQSLNPSWMIFSDGFHQGLLRDVSKRSFDIVVSLLLLALTLPLMAVTALLIRLESPGPVLYRQERVGQGGRVFHVLKFRSMRADAEKDGQPQWAQQNDSRVTRVGGVIRKLRIDELPQIFNVLKGEMSFVGPRPERLFFVEQLARQISYYAFRHNVKPGITGWAQIRYPYGASVEDAIEKLQYDLYYVKNHTLFLDLVVLFQTAQVILFGKGAR